MIGPTIRNTLWGPLLAMVLLSPGHAAAETLFINDATAHTLDSVGTLQEADILLRDGRIRAIGVGLEPPADARVIEAAGRPVTPGFFAGISTLGLEEISLEESTVDAAISVDGLRPEFDVRPAFNPHSSLIPVTRIEGYSWTVLGATRGGSIVGGRGQAVALDGDFGSFRGSRALFVDVGADAAAQSAGSRAWQWMLLEQAMAESASAIDWSPEPLLTVAGRQALAAYRNEGVVVFQADRASDLLQVIEFAQRHDLDAVVSGGAEAWMLADRLATAGIPVLLDALANMPGSFDTLGARLDNAALLHQAGVTIAFGGTETHNARKLRQVAGNAVANGLPWTAGLAAMTRNPALIFGLEEGAGSLKVGSPADIVIWSGDPLEVVTAADQVIVGGRAFDMVSRQTLLRDRYLPRNPELPRTYINPDR